jgi:hypothetical protein
VLGRTHVEADDVTDLRDELRVRAQLPRLHGVRLQSEGPPDPRHRRLRQAGLGRHRPGRPVTVLAWPSFHESARDRRFDLLVGDLARRPGARRVAQCADASLQEPDPPLAGRLPRHPGPLRNPGQRRDPALLRAGQHDPRPPSQRLRRRPLARQSLQRRALIRHRARSAGQARTRHQPSLQPANSSKTQDTATPKLQVKVPVIIPCPTQRHEVTVGLAGVE